MSHNIFELWRNNGELLPFGARRDSWAATTHVLVESIKIRRWPYGEAFGWVYVHGMPQQPLDPKAPVSAPGGVPNISCAGCYQWSYVALDGCPVGEPVPLKPKRVRAVKVRVLASGDLIGFGKYRTTSIDDVFRDNPGWVKWALQTVEDFAVVPALLDALNPSDPQTRIGAGLRQINEERIARVAGKAADK